MDGLVEREWRTIPINPNYEVSNYGEVRNKINNHILKPYIGKNGYPTIRIVVTSKLQKRFTVHRLVAQAFIPNPLGKPCVNHIDYNRANNYIGNLEWTTHSENNLWSGEHISKAKLGKKLSIETRQKMREFRLGKKRSAKDKKTMPEVRLKKFSDREYPPYIYKVNKSYRFAINRTDTSFRSKCFKTIEEAIAFKTNWIKEHEEEFNYT